MAGKGISGTGVTALAGGSLLLWSAVKGRAWSAAFRELISGKKPTDTSDYPIDVPAAGGGADDSGTLAPNSPTTGFGDAKASSYWGTSTASGAPMTATTIASPYLPLNTVVDIDYNQKQVQGVVQDFGPADWVMAADPTRFLDIAEPMMQQLTGKKSNVIRVKYRVVAYGKGRVYRPGAAMTEKLRKQWGGV
jgi:hypothetical protein